MAGYAVVMAALVASLFMARNLAMSRFDSPAAQGDWQQWRDAVSEKEQADDPVRRVVPKSDEPPSLVLLRDYFATCLVTAVVLSTALYWTMVLLIRGAIYGPAFEIDRK
jgi:hypothetical protein